MASAASGGLAQLPDDLISRIFSFLGAADKGRCAAVNSAWRELAYDPQLWTEVRFDVFEQRFRSVFLFTTDYLDPTGEEFARLPASVPTFGRRRASELVAQPRFRLLRSLELVLWHDAPPDFVDHTFCHYFFGNAPSGVEQLTITEKARVLRGREKEPLPPFLDKFELRYIFSRFPRLTHLTLSGLIWDHNVFVSSTLVRNGPVGAWKMLSPFLPHLRFLDASSELDMASPLLAAITISGVREVGVLRVSAVSDMAKYGDPAECEASPELSPEPTPGAETARLRRNPRSFVFYAAEAQEEEGSAGTPLPPPAEPGTASLLAPRVRKLVFEPTALASDLALDAAAARRVVAMRPAAIHGLVYGGAVDPAVWAQLLAGAGPHLHELCVREVQSASGLPAPPLDDPWIHSLSLRCPLLQRLVVRVGLFFGDDSPIRMSPDGLVAALHRLRRLVTVEMDWTPGGDCVSLLQLIHRTCPHILYAQLSCGSVGSLFTFNYFPKGYRPSPSGKMAIPPWELLDARREPRVIEVLRNSLRVAVYVSEAGGALTPVAKLAPGSRPGSAVIPTPR